MSAARVLALCMALGGCVWAVDLPPQLVPEACAACGEDQACDDEGNCLDNCVREDEADVVGNCVAPDRVCQGSRCVTCDVAPDRCEHACEEDADCLVEGYVCCDHPFDCWTGTCYVPE